MNNTHKLLLAFIDASGYEVKEIPVPVSAEIALSKTVQGWSEPEYHYNVTKKKEGGSDDN